MVYPLSRLVSKFINMKKTENTAAAAAAKRTGNKMCLNPRSGWRFKNHHQGGCLHVHMRYAPVLARAYALHTRRCALSTAPQTAVLGAPPAAAEQVFGVKDLFRSWLA